LLLHGWGGSGASFAWLQKSLAKKFTTYVLDLPGFGFSAKPPQVWGSEAYAQLLADFMHAVKIVDPILIGHSFGGRVIINLVSRKLIAVKKIVLISSAGIRLPLPTKLSIKIYFFKLLKQLVKLPLLKTLFTTKLQLYKNSFGSQDYRNAHGIMRAILVKSVNEDLTKLLPLIAVPTLLLWGEDDMVTPVVLGKMMQQLIPNAWLEIFPRKGHFPWVDNHEPLVNQIENFLE
jgi:pimeloyl-ACP methyl ester carboxylesterase